MHTSYCGSSVLLAASQSCNTGKVFEHLKTIDQNKDVNVQFPLDVFGCIDHDWNPDLYTSEVVRSAEANLKNTTAKVDAYATFKQTLSQSMDEIYPGERDHFLNLIKEAEELHRTDAKLAAAKQSDAEPTMDKLAVPVPDGDNSPTVMDADS
ncbi:hypothetical protein SARC_04106 [Sphaeroforma arctica JP610]|uniref:Mediator of RNA polymerase II transcription subunit 10 n=1 Tax=Sphaeroforma arctica JP610 TaxID=667725 RepID=A0A0L0G3M2_9EUKA|nr:hypothetical protein SARC_04106 [Sphaeroforma arctica JP610]KNC83645.1 hypothetical protein SARC_04106 [Sphaeroforma arctica JP610]|eukprot:XP_014157547.1 hypothetical protein SARC_04106 [Sphaeroforma arctica JP610]